MSLRQHDNDLVAVRAAKLPTTTRLPVPCLQRRKDKDDWCWVACTEMVLMGWQRKQKPSQPQPVPEQCELASEHFPGKNCCERGCEEGMPLDKFESFLQKFRPNAKQVGTSMDKATLQPKISEGPVIVAWTNPNHYVVVVDMTGDTVEICDPEPNGGASGQISFSQLENPIYNGKPREWVDTFVDLWS